MARSSVDAVRDLWPAAFRSDAQRYFREVIEINEEVEAGAYVLSFGEVCPFFLVDVAGSEAVWKIADWMCLRMDLAAASSLSDVEP